MSKEKKFWLIEPRDALIVRDGRPFGKDAGNRADSLEFPFPSTTTGAARTRAGLSIIDYDLKRFSEDLGNEVQEKIEVSGAVLAEIKGGNEAELLVPAPADAALFEVKKQDEKSGKDYARIIPLLPLETEGFFSNLNDNNKTDFRLLGLKKHQDGKPHKKAPRFWYWNKFVEWLKSPEIQEKCELEELGISNLEKDRRTHVEMDYGKKSGKDGGLFETRGLEFTRKIEPKKDSEKLEFRRYGLLLKVETDDFKGRIENGIAPLGGERRLVSWTRTDSLFPEIDEDLKKNIIENLSCRLILLTPAIFENGFYPNFDDENITIEAAAVNRYQVISGWDFKIHKPKPTRRMCPAGSVFFLRFKDKAKTEKWIEETWFKCISDGEQDRKDGFGLAVIGNWDGKYLKLEEALKDEENS
jgi:CRISPR-associated protein Cmr3